MNYLILAVRDLGDEYFEEARRFLVTTKTTFEEARAAAEEYKASRGGKYGCIVWEVKGWKEVDRVNAWNIPIKNTDRNLVV